MAIERLGSSVKVGCSGPDCFEQDPHAHQHFIVWPDDDDQCRCTGGDVAVHYGWFRCTPESRLLLAEERAKLDAECSKQQD
jgi:hypothetical protein